MTQPEMHAFQELQVETSIAAYVLSVSCSALRRVKRDTYGHLKGGPYSRLPHALVLNQTPHIEEDPCLRVSGQHILY